MAAQTHAVRWLFCQLRKWPPECMPERVYRPVRPLVLIYNSMFETPFGCVKQNGVQKTDYLITYDCSGTQCAAVMAHCGAISDTPQMCVLLFSLRRDPSQGQLVISPSVPPMIRNDGSAERTPQPSWLMVSIKGRKKGECSYILQVTFNNNNYLGLNKEKLGDSNLRPPV